MSMSMKGLLTLFLLAIVGLAITPAIQTNVDYITAIDQTDRPGQTTSQNASGIIWPDNLTGASRTIVLLFPMFWVVLMIAVPVTYIVVWIRT